MFQQFENELNSFMTEKVKEVAGAAEDIFNTAGKLKEQETKIKMLVKTKKTLKKKISDLETELANTKELLVSNNKHKNKKEKHLDNDFENIDMETEVENNNTNQNKIDELFTPEEIVFYLESTPEFENLHHDLEEKNRECVHYQKTLTEERELHRQEVEILKKNNTDVSNELCKQIQIQTDLDKKIKILESSHTDDKYKIEFLDNNRYFWKQYFWMLFFIIISLIIYQFFDNLV